MTREWSAEQKAFFGWAAFGKSNAVGAAYAGTGKTTTILEAVKHAPERSVLLCAFNKRIADELVSRLPKDGRIQAKTLHSVGFGICRRFIDGVSVAKESRGLAIASEVCGIESPQACVKLVAKAIDKAREMAPLAASWEEILPIVDEFELEPDDEWGEYGWDSVTVAQRAFQGLKLAASMKLGGRPTREIDYADMLFLPIRNRWIRPTYELVVVDECQDMNLAQLLLAQGLMKGRILVVGDRHQAIYGFRGADSGSLDRLKTAYAAIELPLTTTYRCPRTVVAEAAKLVPGYKAAASAPEGRVSTINYQAMLTEVVVGDAILSRKNADAVTACLALIRSGKRARMIGRDIAAKLISLVERLAKGKAKNDVVAFAERLATWTETEIGKANATARSEEAAAAKVAAIVDLSETVEAVMDGVVLVSEIRERINGLFAGNGPAIEVASVHKSKGLEWPRVYLLSWTFRDGGEEDNIRYVAITRAQRELYYVEEMGK